MMNEPKYDVLGPSDPVLYDGRWVEGFKVVGKITKLRFDFCCQVEFLHNVVTGIKRANPAEMPGAIARMEKVIDEMAESLDRRLNEIGDTDPRHPAKGTDDS